MRINDKAFHVVVLMDSAQRSGTNFGDPNNSKPVTYHMPTIVLRTGTTVVLLTQCAQHPDKLNRYITLRQKIVKCLPNQMAGRIISSVFYG